MSGLSNRFATWAKIVESRKSKQNEVADVGPKLENNFEVILRNFLEKKFKRKFLSFEIQKSPGFVVDF